MADIGITLNNTIAGAVTLVDNTVVAAVKGAPAAYPTAGTVANNAEQSKVKQYNVRYAIPPGRIIGFGIETSGAFGPAAKRLLWAATTACGGSPDLIARRYRRFIEEISVALQVATFSNHRRFLTLCVKPTPGAGVAGG